LILLDVLTKAMFRTVITVCPTAHDGLQFC